MENERRLFKKTRLLLTAPQNSASRQVVKNMIFINKPDMANLVQPPMHIT